MQHLFWLPVPSSQEGGMWEAQIVGPGYGSDGVVLSSHTEMAGWERGVRGRGLRHGISIAAHQGS